MRKSYESGNPPLRWRNCIRVVRERRGLTVAKLAQRAGMFAGNLAATEAHMREPTIGTLLRLARVLAVRLDDLIDVETEGAGERFVWRCGDVERVKQGESQ